MFDMDLLCDLVQVKDIIIDLHFEVNNQTVKKTLE